MSNQHDDSEWEYEYDDSATEDYYITLDLTTHVPLALDQEKRNKAARLPRSKSLAITPAPTSVHATQAPQAPPQLDDASSQAQPSLLSADRLQLVDLHSTNPLLSFDNTLYSCEWATDIGTSIFLTPPSVAEPTSTPLRSTPSFDLVGTTSARLLARPATLKPRALPLTTTTTPPSPELQHSPNGTTYTTTEGDTIRRTATNSLHIDLPSTASAARTTQAKFLERLSAIKAQRGDQDVVPVTNIKLYRPPEGWEAERDEWIAKETALSERGRLEAELRRSKGAARMHAEAPTHGSSQEHEDTAALGATGSLVRKRRGGPRSGSGAPSSKKLRESLGMPEKRPPGRPRKEPHRLHSFTPDGDGGDGGGSQEGGGAPEGGGTPQGDGAGVGSDDAGV